MIPIQARRRLSAGLSGSLLVGTLVAQELKPPPPVPQSVLSAPLNVTARVEAPEIVGDVHGTGLRSYLDNSVLPLIQANWCRLASYSEELADWDAAVQFTIRKDGSVAEVKLTERAEHAALGDLAIEAVKRSGPFPAMPPETSAEAVTVRSRFHYDPWHQDGWASADVSTVTVHGVHEAVYRVGKEIAPPRITYNAPPEFSEEARGEKIEGVVVLSMVVTSEGNTDQIKVTRGIGYGLDEKAIEAVRQWKFQPATKDGKPVSVEIAVEVDFHLMRSPR